MKKDKIAERWSRFSGSGTRIHPHPDPLLFKERETFLSPDVQQFSRFEVGTVGFLVFLAADAQAQLAETGSQAVNISVAGRTSDGPGQMIGNGLLRYQDFKNGAFGGTNITEVAAVQPDRITVVQTALVSQLMDTLNLLLLGYQQSVLAEFAPDAGDGSGSATDTTGSIGSDALDDFFGDISGDG